MNRRGFLKFLAQGALLLAVAPTKLLPSVPVPKPEVTALAPIVEVVPPVPIYQYGQAISYESFVAAGGDSIFKSTSTLTVEHIKRCRELMLKYSGLQDT